MGDYESGDNVQNPTRWNVSETTDTSTDAAYQSLDSTPNGMRLRLSLTQLLAELDKRDIRYHPSANRSDLERLLEKSQKDRLSFKELITELDKQDIRYSPTASRQELAALLKSSQDTRTPVETGEAILKDRVPLAEILEELDQRNVRYPPTLSRTELETLLLETKPRRNRAGKSLARTNSRSLQSIINELDERNLRYRPTATRAELEALLSRPPSARVTPDRPEQRLRMPLDKGVLTELDRRDSRYSPTATRAELEARLSQNDPISDASQVTPDRPARRRRMPLEKLLSELDRRGIRYSPTATRAELEALLQNDPISDAPTATGVDLEGLLQNVPISNVEQPTSAQVASDRPARSRRMPLEKLLSELDRLDIRYSPMATRAELEGLLQNAPISDVERRLERRRQRQKSQETPITDLLVQSTRVATKGVQRLPRKIQKIASSSGVTSRLSKVVERATRQARRVSRRASDFWRGEDENGVREPDWHYVKVDTPIDVPAVRLDEDERGPPQTRHSNDPRRPPTRDRKPRNSARPLDPIQKPCTPESRRPPPQVARQPPNAEETWPPVERNPKHRRRKRPATARDVQKRPSGSPFILPPTSEDTVIFSDAETAFQPQSRAETNRDGVPDRKRQKRKPPRGEPNITKRRIYSPYPKVGEEQDAIDRFGNIIADTADRILWGPEDEEDVTRQGRKQDKSEGDDRKGKPRYWKDRLAEQVDYALGIHDDGKYYNSWEKQVERQQRDGPEIETDYWNPFPSGKRKKPSKKGVKHRVPLWEEEGNLVSLLFGRTPSGGKLGIDVS
jgi:hypothetical protein